MRGAVEEMTERQRAYQEYLKSPHWLALRERAFKRDGFKCRRCGAKKRLEAHHWRYRVRWEDGIIQDLVTLCRACHERRHRIMNEKQNRKAIKWARMLKKARTLSPKGLKRFIKRHLKSVRQR